MSAAERRVLVVDDNATFVDNLREILSDGGYEVVTAGSCKDALAKAHGGFDVALVDLKLPDGEGTTLAPKLREIAPDGQVILLTGYATVESAAEAVRAGAWAYLVKPCGVNDLLIAVDQGARQARALGERREAAARALMAEKLAAVGTMTAGLSHEIKNPLNAASLQLAVLDRRIGKLPAEAQANLREPLKLVQDEVARLNRVLEEFLQFARPRELVRMTFDLAAMLSRVSDFMSAETERSGVRLERRFAAPLLASGDEDRLQQAITNLVLNALQATPRGGSVRVGAREGRELAIVIEDSGPGIPEAQRRRVFEPFFTTKSGGSGLGLPLVHSIVEQHGGTIAIDTSELGGARFTLRLPPAR